MLEIDERLMELSEALRDRINPRLAEYGLEMAEIFVSRVVTPDDDPNFRRMKEQFAEQYLGVRQEEIRRREAEAAARRKARGGADRRADEDHRRAGRRPKL